MKRAICFLVVFCMLGTAANILDIRNEYTAPRVGVISVVDAPSCTSAITTDNGDIYVADGVTKFVKGTKVRFVPNGHKAKEVTRW